ncbi:DHHC zinc finger domain-containing protein [Toxoplasma gondii RUB]|uniref:Palmitoyltransferase n=1 Tax=Toxoplasma gondii RUB TaxID=935652 RepID=A0A086LNA4_TOXGO|nr:DHHC zinc finger domain-containing protein [Toxoplasma gondii RUB]
MDGSAYAAMSSWDGGTYHQSLEERETEGERPPREVDLDARPLCSSAVHPSPPLLLPAVKTPRLCCGNRCLAGPEPGVLLFAVFLLSAPAILLCHDVLPRLSEGIQVKAAAGFALLLAAVFGTLFTTAFSDPGIIPRQPRPEELPSGPSRVKFVVINGVSVPQKWCTTCCLFRPPRTKHCSTCDNCVQRFDHHCPWVSNCIGQRNYRVFFFFVFFAALYALAVVVGAGAAIIAEIHSKDLEISLESLWQTARDCPRLAGLFVYGVCCCIPLANLCCFNFYLILNNLTTNEDVLQLFPERNPYSLGCLTNIFYFFSHRVEPSLLGDARPARSLGNAPFFSEPPAERSKASLFESPTASRQQLERHCVLPLSDPPCVQTPASAREVRSPFSAQV